MDGRQFDVLTRTLAKRPSRRTVVTVVTGLLGAALAGPLDRRAALAGRRCAIACSGVPQAAGGACRQACNKCHGLENVCGDFTDFVCCEGRACCFDESGDPICGCPLDLCGAGEIAGPDCTCITCSAFQCGIDEQPPTCGASDECVEFCTIEGDTACTVGGECGPTCTSSDDCAEGEVCAIGTCCSELGCGQGGTCIARCGSGAARTAAQGNTTTTTRASRRHHSRRSGRR